MTRVIILPDDGQEWVAVPEETRERVQQWADAYPESVFKPLSSEEWKMANETLQTVGLSIDRISAANMKHVATKINDMLAAAPPCKAVELPREMQQPENDMDAQFELGWNACLDKILRRAK